MGSFSAVTRLTSGLCRGIGVMMCKTWPRGGKPMTRARLLGSAATLFLSLIVGCGAEISGPGGNGNGAGGGGGAGSGGGVGTGGTSGSGGVCGVQDFMLQRLPPDLLIVQDKSQSMNS